MEYSPSLKSARMTATRDALSGARLELGTAGMGKVLVSLVLGRGRVDGTDLVFPVEESVAAGDGSAAVAQIRTAGAVPVTGLTVGAQGSGAMIQLGTTRIFPGTVVTLSEFTLRHT